MDASVWVGLDVGESTTAICVLDHDGLPVFERSIGSTADDVSDSLATYPLASITAVAMETGCGPTLPRDLAKLGFPVTVFDARKARKILAIRRNKTDQNDARGIAEIARLGGVPHLATHLRRTEAQQIRRELLLRGRLVWLLTASRNSLRSMLRNYGSRIKQLGGANAP